MPSNVELGSDNEIEFASDLNCHDHFTPGKTKSLDPCKFTGVRISSFAKDSDHGHIIEFLINSGLSDTYKDNRVQ